MKCINCGHELKDGAIYCIRCGAMQISMDGERLTEKGWSEVNSIKGGHARDFKPTPENNGKRIAIVVVVILVIAAIIGGVAFALTRPAPEEDDPSLTTSVFSSSSSATSTTSSSSTSTSSTSTSSKSSASSTATSTSSASASAASTQSPATATTDQQPAAQPEPAPAPEPEPAPAPAPAPAYDDEPSYAPEPTSGDYVLADSSSRYYSREELEGMSASDLYYARNEIFARHGRMFHRTDLQSYFESKSWYNPTYTPDQWNAMGDQLSDVERQNSQLMMELEEAKNSGYL